MKRADIIRSVSLGGESGIVALYGGTEPLNLQQVLSGVNLVYPVSSSIRGTTNTDSYITLEEFLIDASLPQVYPKEVELKIGDQEPHRLRVKALYCRLDRLYIDILLGGRGCRVDSGRLITSNDLPVGLTDYPVSVITYLSLPGGLTWTNN